MSKQTQITGQISNTSVKIVGKIENKIKIQGSLKEGARGYSAYELWIKEGNTGTVQDFLKDIDKFYKHNQSTPSEEWTVIHNLNKYPSVTIIDSADTVVYGEIIYVSENELKIKFSVGFSGKAYLN